MKSSPQKQPPGKKSKTVYFKDEDESIESSSDEDKPIPLQDLLRAMNIGQTNKESSSGSASLTSAASGTKPCRLSTSSAASPRE